MEALVYLFRETASWAIYILFLISSGFVKYLWSEIHKMKSEITNLHLCLSDNYTKKNDLREVVADLKNDFKEMTQPLFRKLDRIEEFLLHSKEK